MDWIERVLHVSPDGGSGATELLYIAAGVLLVAAALTRFARRRRRQARSAGSGSDER